MSALIELAERCEAATGPDRELDAEIRAVFGHHWDYAADWGSRENCRPVARAYTGSLDAALMLVPEGWFVYGMGEGVTPIIRRGDTHKRMDFWAEVQREQGGFLRKARAQTLSLALTAAALRATASMEVE